MGRTRFAWDVPPGWAVPVRTGTTDLLYVPVRTGTAQPAGPSQLSLGCPTWLGCPSFRLGCLTWLGCPGLAWVVPHVYRRCPRSLKRPGVMLTLRRTRFASNKVHPSQTGTTQPNWDSPPTWDVPHRVGRLNRLGRPMKEWDDSALGHPTPSPGHTIQAGTSHTNWSIPFFPRLLSYTIGFNKVRRAKSLHRTGDGGATPTHTVLSAVDMWRMRKITVIANGIIWIRCEFTFSRLFRLDSKLDGAGGGVVAVLKTPGRQCSPERSGLVLRCEGSGQCA